MKKRIFHHLKNLILLEDVDIDYVLTSSMISFGEKSYKYFIDYKDDGFKFKLSHIKLQKTKAYVKVIIVKLSR